MRNLTSLKLPLNTLVVNKNTKNYGIFMGLRFDNK